MKDSDYVAAIVECMGEPLDPRNDYNKMARAVERIIERLRRMHRTKKYPRNRVKDRRELIRLLREFDYDDWADKVEGWASRLISPPHPRGNKLKYYCAREIFVLMQNFTGRWPTHSVGSNFNRAASYLYEAVTGEEPQDSLERACSAIVRESAKWKLDPPVRPDPVDERAAIYLLEKFVAGVDVIQFLLQKLEPISKLRVGVDPL